jgi:hypothetical protein
LHADRYSSTRDYRGWQQPTKNSILTGKLRRKMMGDGTNYKRESCNRKSIVGRIIYPKASGNT